MTNDANAADEAGTARSLAARLAAAAAQGVADPVEAWRRLRAAEGSRATIVDRYGIVAAARGLAAYELSLDERLRLAKAAVPDMWPGFSTTTGTERRDPLVVVDYDPRSGLVLRSRDELHRYFRPPGQPREVHVHVCPAGSGWERDHLLFRDYLRGHPAACRAYGEAKRANARIWAGDSWGYTDAKTGVVLDIMADAESWAGATGWAPPRY